MRLWSIHPEYLDAKGLVALWREGLLAQKVLMGGTRGYRHHPQLCRFKQLRYPVPAIRRYLYFVYQEALDRGYKFDLTKIGVSRSAAQIDISSGQIAFEIQHLLSKLKTRDPPLYSKIRAMDQWRAHPMFRVVEGEIADWEIT